MDIITHTISGIAIGTVISGFSDNKLINQIKIMAIAGFGGALPDIDAISLWSGFDLTFGKFFGLAHSGKEIYSSKFWYSHHGFFHSLIAGLLFAFIIGLFVYIYQKFISKKHSESLFGSLKKHFPLLLAFILGFSMHLLEDMPTPASAWGGVNLLWPSKAYIGGTGNIWWWNNYDLFLIILGVVVLNSLLLVSNRFIRTGIKKFTLIIFVVAFFLCLIQIKNREYDFNNPKISFEQNEAKSKEIQKNILGDKIYKSMVKFDNFIRFNF